MIHKLNKYQHLLYAMPGAELTFWWEEKDNKRMYNMLGLIHIMEKEKARKDAWGRVYHLCVDRRGLIDKVPF